MVEWRTLVTPETGQRLAASLEQALAALPGKVSVSFREARDPEALVAVPGPVVLLRCTLTRGAAGPACLLLPGAGALGLVRTLAGEAGTASGETPGPGEEEALRELAGQVAGALASAVGTVLGRPVGFEAASSAWTPGGGRDAAAAEGVVLVLGLSAGPSTTEALLLVPRTALPPVAAQAAPAAPAAAREPEGPRNGNGIELLLDISLPVTVELGRTRMMIRDILQLAPGSVLELDKLAGEPVDIMINEKSIARGEVVVIDENFGVRLTSIVTPSERLMNLR